MLSALGYRAGVLATAITFATCSTARADKPFVFGLPGIPPVFLSVLPYVAAEQGFFKKYGIDVQLRPFDTGAAGARAVASGEIELASAPSSIIINMVANANLSLVAIYGLENSDWLIGSTDPAIKNCKDLSGKQVGVDSAVSARSAALQKMIASCGLKISDLYQGGLSSNVSAAMIAGAIKVGVLHLDDLAVIEEKTKKPLTIVVTMKAVNPLGHYVMFIARADRLARDHEHFVRLLAALIDAEVFMRDPNNWERVAQIAKPTGRSSSEAKQALKEYLEVEFWPRESDGLSETNVEAEIRSQMAIGGIQPGKKPPSYAKLVDHSIWRDAVTLRHQK